MLVREKSGVTADSALRLAQVTGMSVDFWLGVQLDWDLWHLRIPVRGAHVAARRHGVHAEVCVCVDEAGVDGQSLEVPDAGAGGRRLRPTAAMRPFRITMVALSST